MNKRYIARLLSGYCLCIDLTSESVYLRCNYNLFIFIAILPGYCHIDRTNLLLFPPRQCISYLIALCIDNTHIL